MKNILLAGVFGLALVSCSTVSTAKTAQQNRAEFQKLKGEWQITSVDYDKSFKIKPFDEGADAQCFVGSQWKFVPNNYSGTYALNGGGDCPTFTQPIKFEVVNGNTFQFKKLLADTKAKAVIEGYALTLINQTENNFTLQQNVPFDGEIIRVIYNFQKISK